MKVGDIYEKDGKRYEVLEILGMNCWSMKELEDVPEMPVLEEVLEETIEEPPVIVEKKTRGRRKKA